MTEVDKPVPGYYKRRLVRGGPWVPVWLRFGGSIDPATGEECDRSPRWQAWISGDAVEGPAVLDVWHYVAAHPIDAAEYNYLLALKDYAENHAPHLPEATPTKSINFGAMKPLF